jgi:hypothetical protein
LTLSEVKYVSMEGDLQCGAASENIAGQARTSTNLIKAILSLEHRDRHVVKRRETVRLGQGRQRPVPGSFDH